MIYFTSDLHFHHDNIIKMTGRPFQNVEEMNASLIHNWNCVVGQEDEVYILGDFTLKGITYVPDLLARLNGKKYLIRGNHDRFARFYQVDGFEWVKDYYELNAEGHWFVLCHYPFAEWNHQRRGSFHLHGHIHTDGAYNQENIQNGRLMYDVGVDANNYAPVGVTQILEVFSRWYEPEKEG
ncbi:hydrolase [Bengtsoniella intestinalis]|uniref:metallophosphoesterase n=1 Tax=Bengtsoniella intestinalis TaxID=3073143 RepID=UPI00391F92B0